MNLSNVISQRTWIVLISAAFLAGCGQADSKKPANGNKSPAGSKVKTAAAVDPHDVPLTEAEIEQLRAANVKYADAVAHIQSYRDTIRDETTGGDPAKAHRALDNLDLVLEWLPEIASNSGVPKTKWEEVNTTAQNLRDQFNAVHANIDDGKEPDYKSVAAEIDKGVDQLAAIEAEENQ